MSDKTRSDLTTLPGTEGLPPRPLKSYLDAAGLDEETPWTASQKLGELRDYARSQRRERIAAQVMAGFAANPHPSTIVWTPLMASEVSCAWADALMADLDK